MGTENEDIVEIKAFKGLRNIGTPEQHELGDLQTAVNVDINDSGALLRRRGFTEPKVAASVHSLFECDGQLFAVVNDDLCEILPDYSTRVLRPSLTPGRHVSYAPYNGKVFFSNGVETGVIDGGRARSWGLDVPSFQPLCRVVDGYLTPGRYQFALTYYRADSQRSGSLGAGVIDVPDANSGLEFYGFPTPTDADVAGYDLWLSAPNGQQLYRAATFPLGTGTVRIPSEPDSGAALTTQFFGPPPAADIVSTHSGSILVSIAGLLWQSPPYQPELFDVARPIRFPSAILFHAPVSGGVYLGMENSVAFVSGASIGTGEVRTVSEIGVIPGSLAFCSMELIGGQSEDEGAVFMLKDGSIVAGSPSGALANLTRDRFLAPVRDRAAAIVRAHRGMQQYLVVLRGSEKPADV